LPRPKRQRRRAKADRGLPPDAELAKLAVAYLNRQRKHWPKVVEAGLIPEPVDAVVQQMVADFKERHRTGKVDVAVVRRFAKLVAKLAGNYDRFSSDNSNPLSALDQMVNALDKARSEDRFIPWEYVFADYSVTGLDPSRQGYTSYKAILADEDHLVETTYIDDFTRASRDELEWWRLAALSKRFNKRMIGASDGFDVSSPNWDLQVTIYGLLSRLFIKSLREKVRRGMRGAARRRTCLGKQSLGFTRQVHRDASGNVVCGPDGLPLYRPCKDPETEQYRRLLYELFAVQNWSTYKITRHFNSLKVDGWDGWTERAIKQLLWNPSSIGVFIWNRTHREYDWEEGKWVVVENPRSEWEVYYDRGLAIVPMDWWRAARRKLAAMRRASPLTGRKPSRNECSATTLFSGTLFCQHCEAELRLIRSTSKYKQMACLNGTFQAHGCELTTSKSVRVIEEYLLGFLRDSLLTESAVETVVAKANAILEAESRKPQVDVGPLKAEVRKREAKIRKLVARVENEPDEELCVGYDRRIKELQREVNELNSQIRKAAPQSPRQVAPLTVEQAHFLLADIRALLNQDIPIAAEAIRQLTGPIKIRQERVPGRNRGARWIATFSPDLIRLLRHVAKDDRDLAALGVGTDETPQTVEVGIEKVPQYEQLAPEFKRLRDGGASIQSIAAAHGMTWVDAKRIIDFADTGQRPKWKAGKRTGTGSGKPGRYKEIASQVAALRDREKLSFPRIAAQLGISKETARRAYDHANVESVREAAEHGEAVRRGSYSHLGGEKMELIRTLLRERRDSAEIAAVVGCSTSTVCRMRRQMREADGTEDAA
jgi:hypothetical protein